MLKMMLKKKEKRKEKLNRTQLRRTNLRRSPKNPLSALVLSQGRSLTVQNSLKIL
jgi:hypothetical protein